MNSSRLEESGLVTVGKHHLPGYAGFCPQMKFNYGKTYGKTTEALLADEDIATSGKPVLGPTTVSAPAHKDKVQQFRSHLLGTRIGDHKFGDSMVPGYMGYVPKTRNYFGTNYTDVCRNSTADLELDRRKVAYREEELEFIKAVQDGRIELAPEDLPPHLALSPRYASKNPSKANTPTLNLLTPEPRRATNQSPYDVTDREHPDKAFKAGYAGFVPRSRGLFGQVYKNICSTALSSFQDEQEHHRTVMEEPVSVRHHQHRGQPPSQRPLYPEESGMTPRYTGHVPGVRFRHGLTFGKSTKNTKNFQMPDVSI